MHREDDELEEERAQDAQNPEEDLQRRWQEMTAGEFKPLFDKALQDARGEEDSAARRQLEAWRREEMDVKRFYPGFDLAKEAKNPDFADLLSRGAPMRMAYEAAHFDDLVKEAVRYALGLAEMRNRKSTHPLEQAADAMPASGTKAVKDLNREEREKIAKRVLRGERVTLGSL